MSAVENSPIFFLFFNFKISKCSVQVALQIVGSLQIVAIAETCYLFRLTGSSNVFTNNGCVVAISGTYTKRI